MQKTLPIFVLLFSMGMPQATMAQHHDAGGSSNHFAAIDPVDQHCSQGTHPGVSSFATIEHLIPLCRVRTLTREASVNLMRYSRMHGRLHAGPTAYFGFRFLVNRDAYRVPHPAALGASTRNAVDADLSQILENDRHFLELADTGVIHPDEGFAGLRFCQALASLHVEMETASRVAAAGRLSELLAQVVESTQGRCDSLTTNHRRAKTETGSAKVHVATADFINRFQVFGDETDFTAIHSRLNFLSTATRQLILSVPLRVAPTSPVVPPWQISPEARPGRTLQDAG